MKNTPFCIGLLCLLASCTFKSNCKDPYMRVVFADNSREAVPIADFTIADSIVVVEKYRQGSNFGKKISEDTFKVTPFYQAQSFWLAGRSADIFDWEYRIAKYPSGTAHYITNFIRTHDRITCDDRDCPNCYNVVSYTLDFKSNMQTGGKWDSEVWLFIGR